MCTNLLTELEQQLGAMQEMIAQSERINAHDKETSERNTQLQRALTASEQVLQVRQQEINALKIRVGAQDRDLQSASKAMVKLREEATAKDKQMVSDLKDRQKLKEDLTVVSHRLSVASQRLDAIDA